jgi:hypothetical protein
MLDFLQGISAEQIQNWIAVIVAIAALVKVLREKDKTDKWSYIREVVPFVHDVVQKAAKAAPKADKAQMFAKKMDEVLKAIGWTLKPHEEDAVKMLGEGYHQADKAMRADPNALERLGVLLQESEKPEA